LLAEISGAPTKAGPERDVHDRDVLGVSPGATTPWGNVDRKWGGNVGIGLYSVFGPDIYCPTERYGQAPPPVVAAFETPTNLVVLWLDPAAWGATVGLEDLEDFLNDGSEPEVRDLIARFVASTEQQRTDYATQVLAASKACDTEAVEEAADALPPGP